MEERRKNYEAEEERKRREILAQRKKEIQEATEKFQRSNIIKNKRKIKQTERIITPTKTGKLSTTRIKRLLTRRVVYNVPRFWLFFS